TAEAATVNVRDGAVRVQDKTGMDLFEYAAAEALRRREEGMEIAWGNDLNATYRDRLLGAIEILAIHGAPFCADDARDLIGDPPRAVHPNIAGSVFNAAAKVGLIRFVGYTISRRPCGNGNLIRVWQGIAA
ncbi:MAG TPA: hypothetical protein VNG04_05400, partial [Candidatus Acidoferrum sp.]|nr:hypothetical protein [Candidatus Acidoferrum sp.]